MKKSKVDAIVRRKAAESLSAGRTQGYSDGHRAAREEFELQLVPPDYGTGVCVLGGEPPKHSMIFVAIYPGTHMRQLRELNDLDYRDMMMGVSRAAFRPIQMCQTFKTGQRVVWYNYQFEGLG